MDGPKTKRSQTITKLRSRVDDTIMEGIQEVRESGDPEILHDLIDLLSDGGNESIENATLQVLNDLKDPNTVEVLIAIIKKYRSHRILNKLVCACWQNGLDYSAHLPLFIDLAINEDYRTSLEVLSVIEENAIHINSDERKSHIQRIENQLNNLDQEKRYLLEQIVSILQPASGPFRLNIEEM